MSTGNRRLLFISNLFPDQAEPYRGLDNATVLHHLRDRWEIRVLALRPALPWQRKTWQARPVDAPFQPRFARVAYVPKIGSHFNHRLCAASLARPLREVRKAFPFDAVLSSWIYPDSCAIAALAGELAFPFVSIAQGSDVHQFLRYPVRRRVITRAMPAASSIITRSGELARLLADAGLERGKLHTVYNGVDFERFHPADPAAARAELGLPQEGRIMLYVGNFYPVKNPLGLIAAHARCRTPECHLVMIGGGPQEAEARALAGRLQTATRVHFRGRMDAAGVARHLQAADMLAVPSHNEGVPNVILEAFACGCPVVSTRVGGIGEVHPEGAMGRLASPGDPAALAAAIDSLFEARRDTQAILNHGRQFSWERTEARYHALLCQALPNPSEGLAPQ